MEKALTLYVPRPVSWKTETGASAKKLLIVGFEGSEGDALKVLEDRTLAKYHEACEFVKLPFVKDSPEAKKWGVSSAPAIVIADASSEAPEKSPLDKLTGKKSPAALKAALLHALAKADRK